MFNALRRSVLKVRPFGSKYVHTASRMTPILVRSMSDMLYNY